MKKFLAILMTLCLLCGATVLAEEPSQNENTNTTNTLNKETTSASTQIKYTIAMNDSYTITIPSSVTLTTAENSTELSGKLNISLDFSSFNVLNKQVRLKLSSTNRYALTTLAQSNSIKYAIYKGESELDTSKYLYGWQYGTGVAATAAIELTIKTTDFNGGASLPAGDYSDTLTFTTELANVN